MNAIIKNDLTFTANWLGDDSLSVVVTSKHGDLDFDELSNLDWPSDAEISKLVGRTVKFFDGGDSIAEAIYFVKGGDL